MSLIAYPSDMNEAADTLLTRATGGDVPLAKAIHASYHLQGCLFGVLYPDTAVFAATGPGSSPAGCPPECCPCPCTEEEGQKALACIVSHGKPAKATRGAGAGAVVGGPLSDLIMRQVLAYLMTLLQQWLTPKPA